jgi:hypothetical protein
MGEPLATSEKLYHSIVYHSPVAGCRISDAVTTGLRLCGQEERERNQRFPTAAEIVAADSASTGARTQPPFAEADRCGKAEKPPL